MNTFLFSNMCTIRSTPYSFLEDIEPSPYFLHYAHQNTTISPSSSPSANSPPSANLSPAPNHPSFENETWRKRNEHFAEERSFVFVFLQIPNSLSLAATNGVSVDFPFSSYSVPVILCKLGLKVGCLNPITPSLTISPIASNPAIVLVDHNWNHSMIDEFNALLRQNTW
ncbi:LOW QUALITY PROTEIN: hypothetical protein OSB04_008562 [Centaurea solstitialis]|uniref:Uncharacterized protein n=1 Tax=Centaurea solstitialis TaxID=347529 RepID=A0AA38WJL0_9ASTR|nr:LOW QUALITY PROTEIN: hypothetical protein OSB04_008562 [Centaurea solstitialis]